MKFIDSFWFHNLSETFGIVVGEDEHTGKRKGYAAVVTGFNQKGDEAHIMAHGGPVSADYLKEIADKLDPPAPPAPDTTRADIFKEIDERFPSVIMVMQAGMEDRAEWLAFSGQAPE